MATTKTYTPILVKLAIVVARNALASQPSAQVAFLLLKTLNISTTIPATVHVRVGPLLMVSTALSATHPLPIA